MLVILTQLRYSGHIDTSIEYQCECSNEDSMYNQDFPNPDTKSNHALDCVTLVNVFVNFENTGLGATFK